MRRWKLVMAEVVECVRFVCGVDFWRMAVLWTFSLLKSHFKILFSPPNSTTTTTTATTTTTTTTTAETKPLCIITGATSGLGAAAACALSEKGFYVVLVGRSSQLLTKTMREIKTRNKHALLKAFQVDISSLPSVSKFKTSLEQWLLNSNMHFSVQLLINNAGILATSSRLTAEGYDEMIATNYMGAFCLTNLLLPLLKNSPIPSRIVNVTSFTHRTVFSIQFNKDAIAGNCFSRSKRYPCARIYAYTKLYLLLFSYELHRQLGLKDGYHHISVIAADPGVVKTNIMREVPASLSFVAFTALKLMGLLQSPETGIGSILDAALAPPEVSGVYFFGGKGRTINSSKLSYNARVAQELWTTTADLLQSQLALKETRVRGEQETEQPSSPINLTSRLE